ncbi:Pycsar system effector family protein [Spirosoma areae]
METNSGSPPKPYQDSTNFIGEPILPTSKKDKKKKTSRGVETLFRTTLANHLKLSEMADQKANLMISINAILISITISSYVGRFEGNTDLLIPRLLLLFVCLVTIIVALVATNPMIKPTPTSGSDGPKTDLLFFGDYTNLTADDYRKGVRELLANDEMLYNSLIDNVYAQGRVLARKYRLLKFTYRFFMIGFSVVVVSYTVALFFSH